MRRYLLYALGLLTVIYFSYQFPIFSFVLLSGLVIVLVYVLLAGMIRWLRKRRGWKWLQVPLTMILIFFIGLVIGLFRPLPSAIIISDDIEKTLEYAYATDQGDRKQLKFFLPIYREEMVQRDSVRLMQVRAYNESGKIKKAVDKFHAAFILHHNYKGDSVLYRQAHLLAKEAASGGELKGHLQADWLRKATYDRWMLSIGKGQKYNTQGGISFELE
ncbi:hypothetical protein KZP23_13055 [Echinicola marina]|uniref:hypothetical protein n=1 Tax=Echinicola marina TaxID=2859768 RepID=UPI001CF6229E|nr:hypothetical protein [Echinicola marina]UCS91676.1 hypothetical protein KZP23_13055 [Echinicola marina]